MHSAEEQHFKSSGKVRDFVIGMSDGLTVLYRAPRFGRMKNDTHHSGWECWNTGDVPPARNPDNAGAHP